MQPETTASRPEWLTPSRRYWAKWFGFYIGIPVLLALQMGGDESGSATFVAKQYYFYYFLAACLPTWWAMGIMTWLAGVVLKPWQPPLWLVLVLGGVTAMMISGVWAPLRQSLFEPYLAEGSQFYTVFPWRYDDPDFMLEAVLAWTRGGLLWLAANYFFLKVLHFPRFGHGSPRTSPVPDADVAMEGATGGAAVAPSGRELLFDQMPENLGREIIALKAEEHYTRVFTERGEALVLMRFRDAMSLLGDLGGVQTHRSYWVNARHVTRVEREGRNSRVQLDSGLEIPISRSYRVPVMESLQSKVA